MLTLPPPVAIKWPAIAAGLGRSDAEWITALIEKRERARDAAVLRAVLEAAERIRSSEFFEDGLSADLHDAKNKAHAYHLGFTEGLTELMAELRALADKGETPPPAQQEQSNG